MGEREPSHFHDFGTFERVLSSQSQCYLFLETPKQPRQILRVHFLWISKFWNSSILSISEKTGTENPVDASHKILKNLDMRSISFKKHEMGTFEFSIQLNELTQLKVFAFSIKGSPN